MNSILPQDDSRESCTGLVQVSQDFLVCLSLFLYFLVSMISTFLKPFHLLLVPILTRHEIRSIRLLPTPVPRTLVGGQAALIPVRAGRVRLDTRRFLGRCRQLGLRVDYWVVNDPDQARALIERGATGVMTDRPALLAPVVQGLQLALDDGTGVGA